MKVFYKKINSRFLKLSSAGNVKVTKKALKAATKEVYDRINVPFEKTFGVTFAVAQTSVTELNVQVKKSRAELRREKRDKSRADKIHIQEQWAQKACDTKLGTRQTYSQWSEQRMSLSFESPEEAQNRSNKRALLEEQGQRKKKRHSPRPQDLDFDKDGLLQEVNAMKDGERVSITVNNKIGNTWGREVLRIFGGGGGGGHHQVPKTTHVKDHTLWGTSPPEVMIKLITVFP